MGNLRVDLIHPFKEALRIEPFTIRNCSFCKYPIHFFLSKGMLCKDNGCDCTNYGYDRRVVSDKELYWYLDPENKWVPRIERFITKNITNILPSGGASHHD